MKYILAVFKIILQIVTVITFLIYSGVGNLLIQDKRHQRIFNSHATSFYSKLILFFMGVKLHIKGLPEKDQQFLIVSNHLGYIDILAIAAIKPALFITSMDMRETPGLGLITQMGGCIYVERRNRSNINNEIDNIRNVLKEGHNIVLFPEAAAYNGEKIYPFKKSLLTAAAGTGVPIMPMVINFTKVNNETMSHKYRDYVFWYGDLSFFSVGWKANTLSKIEVEIEFLNPIICESEDQRREVAAVAQSQIESKYIPILEPIGSNQESIFQGSLKV